MKHLPRYLQRRSHNRYYIRIAVPRDLQPYFKRREIKRSLGEIEFADAYRLAQLLAEKTRRSFSTIRAMALRPNC